MASGKERAAEQYVMAVAEKGISLNFKVTPEFKREFKGFAVAQGISMTDLLKEGLALSKERRGK